MTTSNSYAYDPTLVEIGLDALARIQLRPPSITADHMLDLRRSTNSVLVRAANKGVNLWAVDEQTVPLVEGVATYVCPASTVMMLDTFVRNYQLGAAEDLTPDFNTTNLSALVRIDWPSHGQLAGYWINVVIPVAIGGLLLYGFYQVTSVVDANALNITASSAATSTASGGAVPSFTTTAASQVVTVALINHGYVAGESFVVQVATEVGGLQLLGSYVIQTTPTANSFTIQTAYPAGSAETVSENSGEAQLAGQGANSQPVDRIITPMSRTDYAGMGVKTTQGPSTSFYFDRQITPQFVVWPVPDGNGPYELHYYRMRQLQTATPSGTETADIPYRFQEWLPAAIAAHMAMKYQPEKFDAMQAYADLMWEEATYEDRQRVPINIQPDFSNYWR